MQLDLQNGNSVRAPTTEYQFHCQFRTGNGEKPRSLARDDNFEWQSNTTWKRHSQNTQAHIGCMICIVIISCVRKFVVRPDLIRTESCGSDTLPWNYCDRNLIHYSGRLKTFLEVPSAYVISGKKLGLFWPPPPRGGGGGGGGWGGE